MSCQPSQREQIAFRRAYRALLAQGLDAVQASKELGKHHSAVREDLMRHPLDEPLPDVENLLSSSELAAALGISYQQLPKRLSRFRIAPACRYCRVLWYPRDCVERLKDVAKRIEAFPLDRIGEVKTFATNFTTRKIYLFESGAPIERVTDPTDKCVSPAVAEAECRIWRKQLDPEHYALLEQLLRFRVAIWRARVQRNREGFEPSSAGSIGDCGERQRTRLKQAGSGILSRLRGVRITGDAE